MSKIPLGLQLYSVRDECEKDLPGTLSKLADMGYQGVEFAGYYGRSAAELKKMLAERGLKCCGTHTPWDSIQSPALQATLDFSLALGNPYVVFPWIPEEKRKTKADWLAVCELFNQVSAKAEAQGLHFGYHNHSFEFQDFEGEVIWDLIASHTDPKVILQLDSGNAAHGGADDFAYLKKYASRAVTWHLKETDPNNKAAVVGDNPVKWKPYFDVCEAAGKTEWYIVEQENGVEPAMNCVQRCMDNLKKMGK
jgi:sugar phosphate isomerase/epimerase